MKRPPKKRRGRESRFVHGTNHTTIIRTAQLAQDTDRGNALAVLTPRQGRWRTLFARIDFAPCTLEEQIWRLFWILLLPAISTIVLTGVHLGFSREWIVLVWIVLSLSTFWVFNRLLHAFTQTSGESERDGVIWVFPLSMSWIPATAFIATSRSDVRAAVLMLWSSLVGLTIQILRPDTPTLIHKTNHTKNRFMAFLASLIQYDLGSVSRKPRGTRLIQGRMSVSTLALYFAFGIVASGTLVGFDILRNIDPPHLDPATYDLLGYILEAFVVAYVAVITTLVGAVTVTQYFARRDTEKTAPESPNLEWAPNPSGIRLLAVLYTFCVANLLTMPACLFFIPFVIDITRVLQKSSSPPPFLRW